MIELLQTFHFLRPLWLIALVPAVLVWWLLVRAQDIRHAMGNEIAPHLLERLITKPKRRPVLRPIHLLLPVWILSIVAVAGPTMQLEPSPFADDKSSLMIVIQMTDAMMNDDLQPTRLERSRIKIHELLQLRQGAATGLIVYAGTTHLVMPPTTDREVIEHMLESLEPEIMPQQGDSLAAALQLAENRIRQSQFPGSILVVAASVEPLQITDLEKWREASKTKVQFLVPVSWETPFDRIGVSEAAQSIGAKVHRLSVDNNDVRSIVRHSKASVVATLDASGARWRDDGYLLLPLIAIGLAFWGRRGWSLATE